MPGTLLSGRKKSKPKRSSRTPRNKSKRKTNHPLPFNVTERQRNEAIGLVMVGASAFSLSLLHYLGSAKISGIINYLMVNLGMGVYILPALFALMGIQKFLERPFQNLSWRIGGTIGTMIFGLGLLGMEGGKLGVHTMQLFSEYFGKLPSQILFFFLFMSSLIFALDILYKDLLGAGIVMAGLTTRLMLFCWEASLAMIAMLIGAVKTTFNLLSLIFNRIRNAFEERDLHPATQLGKLLSFKPKNELNNEQQTSSEENPANSKNELSKEVTDSKDPEEAIIIPVPQCWKADTANEVQGSDSVAENNSLLSVQVNQISTQSIIPAAQNEKLTDSSTPATESSVVMKETDDCQNLQVFVEFEDDFLAEKIEEGLATEQTDDYDETDFLEDNQIDKEIKSLQDEPNETTYINPYSNSKLPSLDLLRIPPPRDTHEAQSDLSQRSALLLKTLEEFGLKASVTAIVEGPAVSRFELKPAPGVKVSRITSLADDIALALAAQAIRIEAPIPGKPALGIEIPNTNPTPVYFYDLLKNDKFNKNNTPLNLALGVTISGKPVFSDLSDMPHLLIAGSTGSGKSVCVNTIIASILYQARADQVKFVMIDPKMVELSTYNGIPHLISPVVTDPAKAASALMWAVEEMEKRYELLAGCGVRKISTYNDELERLREEIDPELESMPFIVIIIDELADLMMTASAEVESSICRLAQMARAVGIHLVIATQRPSVNVLTGVIKANLPTRIAFSVTSAVDSRTILDAKGAERLLGKGDMLFIPKGRNKPLRLQGAFISDRELMDITEFVKSQGEPEYMDIAPENEEEDEETESGSDAIQDADAALISKIIKYLETQEKTSTSMLQRKFRIGYNRAARIMDQLEENGMVSPMDGANKRRVLVGRSNSGI
jgi:DNA segregation ATPase FtsK/SpoIIIE-like protein